MVKRILLALVGLALVAVVAILGIAASRPNTYRVERSATLAAPPAAVFALVNDFHRFPDWSPWEKLDPNMARTISDPGTGVGATYQWKGSGEAGEGRMTITESVPDSKVGMKLEFLAPWKSTCGVEFNVQPAAEGTHVQWVMNGDNPFVMRVMTVFMDMDAAIGKDFEEGLANLGRVAATMPPMPPDSTRTEAQTGS